MNPLSFKEASFYKCRSWFQSKGENIHMTQLYQCYNHLCLLGVTMSLGRFGSQRAQFVYFSWWLMLVMVMANHWWHSILATSSKLFFQSSLELSSSYSSGTLERTKKDLKQAVILMSWIKMIIFVSILINFLPILCNRNDFFLEYKIKKPWFSRETIISLYLWLSMFV